MPSRLLLLFLACLLILFTCVAGLSTGAFLTARSPFLFALLASPTPTAIAAPTPRPTATPVDALAAASDPERKLVQLYLSASPAVVNITTQCCARTSSSAWFPKAGRDQALCGMMLVTSSPTITSSPTLKPSK